MIIQCPLCQCPEVVHLEMLQGDDINWLYEKAFGIENALTARSLEYLECPICDIAFFWPMETGDQGLYEQLQIFDWYYMANKEEYRIALSFLPQIGSVLEVGAGKAEFAALVGKERYTGLEYNDLAIRRAAKKGLTLFNKSVETLAREEKKYDAVVSFQVLEHVKSPRSFLAACVDCLNPGGVLVIGVPSRDGFTGDATNNILDMPPHHVTRWSQKTLSYLPGLFGLDILAIQHEPIADYHLLWARSVQIEKRIRKTLGIRYKLLDRSFRANMVRRVSGILARMSKQSLSGGKGHTIVAGYKKKK